VSDAALLAGATGVEAVAAGGLSTLLATAKAKILVGTVALGLVCATLLLLHNRRPASPATSKGSTSAAQQAQSPANIAGQVLPANQASSTVPLPPAPFEGLRLTLLAADSGQPVPNVTIDFGSWEGTKFTRKKLQGTRAGTCEVPFSRASTKPLGLTTQLDGFADTRLEWRPDRGEQIPAEYTVRLARPVPIGGQVVDADGQPVANAKVGWNHEEEPAADTRPESHAFGWIEVETDAEGKWSINRIAEDMIRRLYGRAGHPEHARSKFAFVNREPDAEKQLRERIHVFRLGRASIVRGVVVDSEDRPVPGAKVLVGDLGDSSRRETSTDLAGAFAVAGCKLGPNKLTAEAAGFAPTTMAVEISEHSEPYRIRLVPGKTLWLRVVDKAGQPIVGANAWYNTFERGSVMQGTNRTVPVQVEFSPKTDAQGRAVWENAPDQELIFNFHKRGYMRVSDVRLRPDGQEHQVTLPPALTIKGTVTDASTGKPVPQFRIVCGWPEQDVLEGGTRPRWSTLERFWISFDGGTFRHTLEEPVIAVVPNPGYVFKFEAEGYAPSISRTIALDEGEVQLTVKLQPGQNTAITVLMPDGRPAANAQMGLVSAGVQLRLLPSGFDRRSLASVGSVLSADAKGRVSLPPDEAIQNIVAVHDQGYAAATSAGLRAEPTLRLQSWGRVEGTYWAGGQPAAGRELQPGFIGSDASSISFDFEAYRVTTDAQGRFTFAKVPPVRLKLIRLIPSLQSDGAKSWSHKLLTEMDVRPGETTQIELGKSDRTVVLRLRWPDGWQLQPGWRLGATICTPVPLPPPELRTNPPALLQWQRRPDNQAAFASAHFFSLKQADDGSWKAEEVTPGDYVVRAFVTDTNAPASADNLVARFEAAVVVAEEPSGGVLDLGELPVQPMAR